MTRSLPALLWSIDRLKNVTIFPCVFSGYLKQVLKEKQKFIIFAHHIKMLDAISKYLSKQKVDFIRIDGTTRSDLRSVSIATLWYLIVQQSNAVSRNVEPGGKISNQRFLSSCRPVLEGLQRWYHPDCCPIGDVCWTWLESECKLKSSSCSAPLLSITLLLTYRRLPRRKAALTESVRKEQS